MRASGAWLILLAAFATSASAQETAAPEPAGQEAPAQDTTVPETPAMDAPDIETAEPQPLTTQAELLPERIEIGLSTETIAITSDFAGADLTIFGAVDNVDPLIQRQSRYDVFVVLEGPHANLVTRRKARVLGVWANVDSQGFIDVPESFLIASTRPPQDVTDSDNLARLSLNVSQMRLRPMSDGMIDADEIDEFSRELRRLKQEGGLYQEFPTGVRFISQSLFRATLRLPANVPLGRHFAKAYLFRQGVLVAQTQAPLEIKKAGAEFQIYKAAQDQSLLYGLAAVLLAFVVGWLGRVIFRRD